MPIKRRQTTPLLQNDTKTEFLMNKLLANRSLEESKEFYCHLSFCDLIPQNFLPHFLYSVTNIQDPTNVITHTKK